MKIYSGMCVSLSLIVLLLMCSPGYAQEHVDISSLHPPIVGVIIPIQDESLLLQKSIMNNKVITISGIKYNVGKINNASVVFVNSGLGKINSAVITTRLIADFHPDLILMSGSSGNINPSLKKGDIVIGKEVINADFGTLTSSGTQFQYSEYLLNPQKNTLLPLKFNLDNKLLKIAYHLPKKNLPNIYFGKIATSDALPNQSLQIKTLQEGRFDVVEMEGAPFMQACWLFNTPCMIIRGVSNDPKESITKPDIILAADNAAKVLIAFLSHYR